MLAGEFGHAVRLLGDCGRVAVCLNQQNRRRIAGKANLGKILHAIDRHRVEKLQSAWNDLCRDDGRHRLSGAFHRCKDSHERPARGGFWDEFEQDLGDNAERPLGADEEVPERVSGNILYAFVTCKNDLSRGQHDFQAHHIILRHAILQSAQSAGVFRDIAADR